MLLWKSFSADAFHMRHLNISSLPTLHNKLSKDQWFVGSALVMVLRLALTIHVETTEAVNRNSARPSSLISKPRVPRMCQWTLLSRILTPDTEIIGAYLICVLSCHSWTDATPLTSEHALLLSVATLTRTSKKPTTNKLRENLWSLSSTKSSPPALSVKYSGFHLNATG